MQLRLLKAIYTIPWRKRKRNMFRPKWVDPKFIFVQITVLQQHCVSGRSAADWIIIHGPRFYVRDTENEVSSFGDGVIILISPCQQIAKSIYVIIESIYVIKHKWIFTNLLTPFSRLIQHLYWFVNKQTRWVSKESLKKSIKTLAIRALSVLLADSSKKKQPWFI